MYVVASFLPPIGCVPLDTKLSLKILDTKDLRRQGFMRWSKPPGDSFGLLFFHTVVGHQSYWMKDVPFDLDCLGFDEDDKLVEVLHLGALSTISRAFSRPVKHVVEVRGGWCERHGLKGGEKLVIRKV